MTSQAFDSAKRTHSWWHRPEPYTRVEVICDALVHIVGLAIAAGMGGVLMAAAGRSAITQSGALVIYVLTLVITLLISLGFNMARVSAAKMFLARLDQAALFLLIAGTYTPLLALLSGNRASDFLLVGIWSAAAVGSALKLAIPQHFGRLALPLYGAIGWSGVLIFNSLAATLPAGTLALLLGGGIAYSTGIIFHVWDRLRFHNVIWHCFVVLGATLHLWAVLIAWS